MAGSASSPGLCKDRRLYPRKHLLWSGSLARDGSEEACVILDLSAGGAMLRLADGEPRPSNVTLSNLRLGALPGRIVWQEGDIAGLRFFLRPQQVARMAAEAAPYLALAS